MQHAIRNILLLLFATTQTLWAQDKRVEQFVNEVAWRDMVPAKQAFYYLLDTSHGIDAAQAVQAFKALAFIQTKDSHFTADVLKQFNLADTAMIRWSDYNLERCRVIPNYSGDSICSHIMQIGMVEPAFYELHRDSIKRSGPCNTIYAPVSSRWGKKRRMAVIAAYGDSLRLSIPPERDDYFRISRPAFTADDQYAIIWYGRGEHNYCLFIYRKETNGSWQILTKIFCIS